MTLVLETRSGGARDLSGALDFLWLELTQKCNLTCKHCYVSSGPSLPLHGAMTHADWVQTISDAGSLGCRAMQFIGGEPMLYPQLCDLIEVARTSGIKSIEIYTNGTPISEAWVERLKAYEASIACSLYAPTAEIHDSVTQKPGSFDRTIAALRRLANADVPVRIGFIEMEENEGRFEATKALLKELGIERVAHDHVRGFGRGAESKAADAPGSQFGDLCGQCWKGSVCVTATGDAFPCIMSRAFKVGNVLEQGLVSVVSSKALRGFRREQKDFEDKRLGPDPKPCMVCSPGPCAPDMADPPPPPAPPCIPTCPPRDPCTPRIA